MASILRLPDLERHATDIVRLASDQRWLALDDTARLRYVELLALASTCRNRVPDDTKFLRKHLGGGRVHLDPLVRSGLVVRNENGRSVQGGLFEDDTMLEMADPVQEMFDRFWLAYPRKENKQRAFQVFRRVRPTREEFYAMMDALQDQIRYRGWVANPRHPNYRFIPHPTSWLNGRRWEDQIPKAADKETYL